MERISWEELFMNMAVLTSMRSPDPKTKVGACIVKNNYIVSVGYNGFPKGVDSDAFPLTDNEDFEKSKHAYIIHAELNAILNAKTNLEGCVLYVTLFPCNECAKIIAQTGIKEIIYLSDSKHDKPYSAAARKIFEKTGISCRQYKNHVIINK